MHIAVYYCNLKYNIPFLSEYITSIRNGYNWYYIVIKAKKEQNHNYKYNDIKLKTKVVLADMILTFYFKILKFKWHSNFILMLNYWLISLDTTLKFNL